MTGSKRGSGDPVAAHHHADRDRHDRRDQKGRHTRKVEIQACQIRRWSRACPGPPARPPTAAEGTAGWQFPPDEASSQNPTIAVRTTMPMRFLRRGGRARESPECEHALEHERPASRPADPLSGLALEQVLNQRIVDLLRGHELVVGCSVLEIELHHRVEYFMQLAGAAGGAEVGERFLIGACRRRRPPESPPLPGP